MDSGLLFPWNGRAILLVDLDAFFASVEQLDHPEWRGKPVIVGGSPEKRGVVSTCSYEARVYGVRSAMASAQAAKLCPDAIWTPGHHSRYKEVSNAIMDILRDETPLVQQVSIDEAFMDVTPNELNTEHPVLIAERIQARVKELGVTCSIGVGTSKSVAKIASDMDKPRGLTVVYPGSEHEFLDPLPVRIMSGIGASAERALRDMNILTLKDLRSADLDALTRVFGVRAQTMWERADGSDSSPVITEEPVKSVSNEVTFAEDLTTREDIDAALNSIAAKVGRRLRRKGLAGYTVSLKVRYDDRSVRSAQTTLSHPTDNELDFGPRLSPLLEQVWEPGMKVRLLGVGISGFDEVPPVQESLFGDLFNLSEEDKDGGEVSSSATLRHAQAVEKASSKLSSTQKDKLVAATDLLKDKFGEKSVRFGHELRHETNTTGSSSKNPADYK